MTKAIKEIIIMLLVCLVVMLALAVALYQYIPSRKEVQQIKTYAAAEEIKDLLEDDIDKRSEEEQVVYTYEVTKSDLSNYQKINEYVPGKANPLETYTNTISGETNTEASSENIEEKIEPADNAEHYQQTSSK